MTWWRRAWCGVTALGAMGAVGLAAQAGETLGTVRLPVAVIADGRPLPAGAYSLRLSTEAVRRVIGQGAQSEQWVEFVQGSDVKGRELASVVAAADAALVGKRTPPAAGRPVVQALRGSEYVRVWGTRDGKQYLLHLRK